MRILRVLSVIISVIVITLGAVLHFTSKGKSDAPKISCSADQVIEATISVTDQELLSYVTATDNQDGDITDKIKVVRKNYFVAPNTTLVTYSVCDSDNNVTTYQQKVFFADYHSPEIYSKHDFVFTVGMRYNIPQYVTASDVIDGDLTNYVKIISNEFSATEGYYPINLKVSNSMTDGRDITINAIVTSTDFSDLKIRLTKFITYASLNENIDYKSLIKDIYNRTGTRYNIDDIKIDSSAVDITKPGVYDVYYTLGGTMQEGKYTTFTRLVVVVSEE